MNQMHIAFLAECYQDIGTGHIVETLLLAERCGEYGMEPHIWTTPETPEELIDRASTPPGIVPSFSVLQLGSLQKHFEANQIEIVITNFRCIDGRQVQVLKSLEIPVICIDELGQRRISPDVIINNSIVRDFHQYPESDAQVYTGPAYICMSRGYQALRLRSRSFRGIDRVLVSMGGTDRSRASLRILDNLLSWKEEAEIHVVAGPGFDFIHQLEAQGEACDRTVYIHRKPSSLCELIGSADVGITAGGNTLYEMACVGTPAIVVFEDEHEKQQGKAFEAEGFGRCVGRGAEISAEEIHRALDNLDDPEKLTEESERGQSLVDGLGVDRILRIVSDFL